MIDSAADQAGREAAEVAAEADVSAPPKLKARLIREDRPDRGGDGVEAAATGDHEGRAEDAEDRAGSADRQGVGTEQQRPEGAAEE